MCKHKWREYNKKVSIGRAYNPGYDWESPYYTEYFKQIVGQQCENCDEIKILSEVEGYDRESTGF